MKKRKFTRHEDFLREQLKNAEFRKHYEAYELNYQIAKALIVLRKKLNLTQNQLAAKLDITQQSYGELETMEGRNYTIELLQKIAGATRTELYIKGRKVKFIDKKAA